MNIRTREQWIHHLAALRLPEHVQPDDNTLATVLLDVIVDEQARLSDETLAVLSGVIVVLLGRGMAGLTPRHADAEGRPLYTDEQLAAHLGVPLERVRAYCAAQIEKHGEAAGCFADIDPETLNSLN